jgi:DNA (cytosine-5)-methyltransferase 1
VKVLDLFSGIGGFSLGLERAGMQTVAFCEIEPFCRKILRKHWPSVPIYEDVTKLTAKQLTTDGISVDVICGGFPCQDISTAGKGAGIGGERSGLWKEYARLIGQLRPRYVIVENVSALLGRGLSVVLGDLAEIGYDAEWHCIPASAVGAPHRRDRVWIIASWQGMGGYAKGNSSGAERSLSEGADANAGRANPGTRPNSDADNPTPLAHARQHAEGAIKELDRDKAKWGERKPNAANSGEDVAHAKDKRSRSIYDNGKHKEQYQKIRIQEQLGGSRGNRGNGVLSHPTHHAAISEGIRWGDTAGQWWAEPNVGRVAYGVPKRVDRLKALGNAVVPQIPEIIGRAIMEDLGR